MCLLCSGVFCCVPFKPLSLCWSSMAQMTNKELSRTENIDAVDASKPIDQTVNADIIRKSYAAGIEAPGHCKLAGKLTPSVLDKNPGRIKSLSALTKGSSLLDCSTSCCLVPGLKSSKGTNNIAVYRSTETEKEFSYNFADARRGSDPGYKNQDINGYKHHKNGKTLKESVLSINAKEKYKKQSHKYELNTSVVFVDDRSRGMSQYSHYNSNIITTTEPVPKFDISAYNFPSSKLMNTEYAIMETNPGGATLRRGIRKPRYSSRSHTTASNESVSEVTTYAPKHVSPSLRRKKTSSRSATRNWKCRDVSQTTNPVGSGDVLVMDSPMFAGSCSNAKAESCGDSCDAMTMTEWNNGWEPLPNGFLSLFRDRAEQMPLSLPGPSVAKEGKQNHFNNLDQMPQAMAALSIMSNHPDVAPHIFNNTTDEASGTETSKISGIWGSMDNFGFLSSGESSDQTRTSNQTSSTNYQRYRAKDDWAVYKASRSEDYYNAALPRYQSDTSLDREMAQLSQEMACIQLECEVLVSRHINERMRAGVNEASAIMPIPGPSHGHVAAPCLSNRYEEHEPCTSYAQSHRGIPITLSLSSRLNTVGERAQNEKTFNGWMRGYGRKQGPISGKSSTDDDEADDDKTSSSAYNTGESSGSTAMGQAGSNTSGEFQKSLMTLILRNQSDTTNPIDELDKSKPRDCNEESQDSVRNLREPSTATTVAGMELSTTSKDNLSQAFSPGTIMYTNEAHLQHTIVLQQQLLRKAFSLSGNCEQKHRCHLQSPNIHHPDILAARYISCQEEDSSASKTAETEWRVKRRPDGTRYITRRPSRNKILKERALRISEERRGLTTDDDATSELKLGRYWSKEERKRHLERARERRKKELMSGRNKLSMVREGHVSLLAVQEEEPLVLGSAGRKSSSSKYSPLHPALGKITNCSKLARTSALLSVTTV